MILSNTTMRHLIVLMFALVRCYSAKSSTFGKDFYFGILPFYDSGLQDSRNIITIDVTNVSPNDVRIRMQIPYFNNDSYYNVPTGQNKTVIIPPSLQRDGTFKDSRGIRITSDGDVSVVVSNRYNNENTMDVYNVLPTKSLGRRYMIAAYRGTDSSNGCTFLVTGVYNNTNLTVKINDSSNSVLLNALDVYQYTCNRGLYICDLSGALLNSDKNIAVTAGASYSDSLFSGNDYFASEMIPTSAWTTTYIVPPLYPQPGYTIRVMSEYDTFITLSNTSHSLSIKADLHERYFENLPVLASSNQAFSVYQYGVRYNYNGDPFLAVVPGIKQYINDFMFTVPQAMYGNTKPYIALIVPLRMKDTLILDGMSVQSRVTNVGDIRQLSVPHPFDNYTVLTFETTEGVHHFWHPQRDVTFGVFVYGIGQILGYGFYAGYDLKGTEGTTVDMLTTTENSFHPVTEDIPDSTTTYVTEDIITFQRLMCYTCNDLTHPDLCDTVQKCASNEMCFLKIFTESGQRKFHSGCLGSDVCNANQHNTLPSDEHCFECCHTDYCNNKGCGEPGIPDRNSRGPICFDCQHVSSHEECHKVTPCELHQVCRIEENKWFEHSHFKLGCGDSLCDPVSRVLPINHVLKRAIPVCYACCSDDYCNRNCTIQNGHPNVPNIIG